MRPTDALIARLAECPLPPAFYPGRIAASVILSIMLPVAAFLLALGPRPDLLQAWTDPVVPFKTLLPLTASVLSLVSVLRLARPGVRAGAAGWGLLVPAAVALVLWSVAFVLRPAPARFAEVGAFSLGECLGAILILSVVPVIAIMRVLRRGAPTQPGVSGALVGLTAATGATAGYSLFCTQDNPLFFVTWYGVAILAVTIASAAFGRRALRW